MVQFDKKWVTLNVGGTIFMTSRSTLTKSTPPSSPLHRISNNSTNVNWDRDETGAYLIDRDPAYFQPVLNYLRHGRLVIPHDVPDEGVLIEAEYFSLPELVKLIKLRTAQRRLHQLQPTASSKPIKQTVDRALNMVAPQATNGSSQQSLNSLLSTQEFVTNYVNNVLADI